MGTPVWDMTTPALVLEYANLRVRIATDVDAGIVDKQYHDRIDAVVKELQVRDVLD